MDTDKIIRKLESNLDVITNLLINENENVQIWRPEPNHWCLLEIICHLVDEEKEDFRKRTFHLLENPGVPPPSFNPLKRIPDYMSQNLDKKLKGFKKERLHSIALLQELLDPKWENAYDHPKLGSLSALFFLKNWLAHDYLHIRQITKIHYLYLLDSDKNTNFGYAGNWVL